MSVEEEPVEEEDEKEANEEVRENTGRKKTIKMEIRRKGLMELVVICLPLMHVACIVYPVLYYLSLDMPILLISVFPLQSRNVFTIVLCLTWETLFLSVLFAWTIYLVFAIISFVLTFKDSVDLTMRKISR